MRIRPLSYPFIYRCIYGSIAVAALISVSLAAAQEIGNENIRSESGTTAVAIVEEDEPDPEENGRENQIRTGTPVTNIGIRASYDSGTKGDNITNNTRPSIGFTKASNGSITARYRKSGAASWISSGISIATLSTSGTVTLPNLTAGDGDYEVEITQTISSVAGKATYTFTLDTTAPTVYTRNGPLTPESPVNISDGGDVRVTLAANDNFGASTAFSADGTLLAVGAYGNDTFKGAVYLFEDQNGTRSQVLKISDNNGGTGELDIALDGTDFFGASTALSADGTLLAAGASGDDDGNGSNSGSVYLFEKSDEGTWSQTLKISENGGGAGKLNMSLTANDYFGSSASLSADGTVLAVGAFGDGGNKGAVYLFQKSGGTWSQVLKISDNSGGTGELDIPLDGFDHFHNPALSADGTLLAVGAYGDDDGNGNDSGAVYLFEKSNGTWTQILKISENGGGAGKLNISLDGVDSFGSSTVLSADGTLLAVGALGDDDGNGSNSGAAYLFERSGGTWTQTMKTIRKRRRCR